MLLPSLGVVRRAGRAGASELSRGSGLVEEVADVGRAQLGKQGVTVAGPVGQGVSDGLQDVVVPPQSVHDVLLGVGEREK